MSMRNRNIMMRKGVEIDGSNNQVFNKKNVKHHLIQYTDSPSMEVENSVISELPSLLCNESQNSTEISSVSSSESNPSIENDYVSKFNAVFEDNLCAATHILPISINDHKKQASNNEIYFPRVFSQMILGVKNPCDFLSRHEITPQMRSRMIDWMIEVLKAFNQSEQTFSLSVAIMDAYFAKVQRVLAMQELHVIGVTCMFISSKYEELIPLSLQKVFEKIGHEKIPKMDIKKKEAEILAILEYEVNLTTLTNMSMAMITYLEKQQFFKSQSDEEKDVFESLNAYIVKLATFDYDIMRSQCFKYIAICGIFVTTTVMNHCFDSQLSFPSLHLFLDIIGLNYDSIIPLFNALLNLAQTFQSNNPTLKNLSKYNLQDINTFAAKITNRQRDLQKRQPHISHSLQLSSKTTSQNILSDTLPHQNLTNILQFQNQQTHSLVYVQPQMNSRNSHQLQNKISTNSLKQQFPFSYKCTEQLTCQGLKKIFPNKDNQKIIKSGRKANKYQIQQIQNIQLL